MNPPRVVAVDGPAAAGKGTLARRLARELGLPYLDTGLLYRAVGRRVLDAGGDPRDAGVAENAARALASADLERGDLRGPEADMAASAVATLPQVRAALVDWQREFGRRHGAVMDGRDIGTVIFPDAPAKIFVTASPEARARRRHAELAARGVDRPLADVQAEMQARDAQDAARATAPMKPAEDAVLLDTTALGIEEAFGAALEIIRARLAV
jgi:cytidylate kinase